MGRRFETGASAVPLAPILVKTSTYAYGEVTLGIREFDTAVRNATGRRDRLNLYLRVALEHLYRTYLTLLWEVERVCCLDADQLQQVIPVLMRRSLVTRVHQGAGDFAVIHRAYHLLANHAKVDIPERLTNREVHLFALLVPLAAYTDELAKDLETLLLSGASASAVEARLVHARREIEPVLRHLGLATRALKHFIDELKSAPPEAMNA
jgi:hypothetical protein